MNAGLGDAHNLTWKLSLVCQGKANPQILHSYEQERHEPIWAMIRLAVAMGEFVMPTTAVQRALKDSLLNALERFPKARDYLFQMRFKPHPRYETGLFIERQQQPFEAPLAGEMLPQPWVLDRQGNRERLDTKLGPGVALLCQDQDCIDQLSASAHPLIHRLAMSRVCLVLHAGIRPARPVAHTSAVDASCVRALRAHRDQIIRVRPDRYGLGACWPAELNGFLDRVQQLFAGTQAGEHAG